MHHKFVGVFFQEFGDKRVVFNISRLFKLLVRVSILYTGVLKKRKNFNTPAIIGDQSRINIDEGERSNNLDGFNLNLKQCLKTYSTIAGVIIHSTLQIFSRFLFRQTMPPMAKLMM